jgi:hypothetical protein
MLSSLFRRALPLLVLGGLTLSSCVVHEHDYGRRGDRGYHHDRDHGHRGYGYGYGHR